VDPNDPATRGWTQRFTDRGTALLLILLLSVAVFLFNFSITVYATKLLQGNGHNFADILQPDKNWSCDVVRQYNRWLHFAINALSTILLGASNYCAQLLLAPMRKDIDRAHGQSKWLDIGVQSFRNLRACKPMRKNPLVISHAQVSLVTLMASPNCACWEPPSNISTSWNSAVFAATPFSTHEVGLVTADYLDDWAEWRYPLPLIARTRQNANALSKIDKAECIQRYAGKSAGLAGVLIVSSNATMSHGLSDDEMNHRSSLLNNFTTIKDGSDWGLNSDWICSAWAAPGRLSGVACTEKFIASFADTWTLRLWTGLEPDDVYTGCVGKSRLLPGDG
jgi:hypothetical protein